MANVSDCDTSTATSTTDTQDALDSLPFQSDNNANQLPLPTLSGLLLPNITQSIGSSDNNQSDLKQRFHKVFSETNSELLSALDSLTDLSTKMVGGQPNCKPSGQIIRPKQLSICSSSSLFQSTSVSSEDNSSSYLQSLVESPIGIELQSLIDDTRLKCERMVSDNNELSTKLDDDVSDCQNQLITLQKQLKTANRDMEELEANIVIVGSATESDNEDFSPGQALEATVYRLREDNSRLTQQVHMLQQKLLQSQTNLIAHFANAVPPFVGMDVDHSEDSGTRSGSGGSSSSTGSTEHAAPHCHIHIQGLQDTVQELKLDRKRLKDEKIQMLEQMRQVYALLDNKETELREFIRQYEAKVRDSEKGVKQLVLEKDSCVQEKCDLESSLVELTNKLDALQNESVNKTNENENLQQQLRELQGRFLLLTGHKLSDLPSQGDSSKNTRGVGTIDNQINSLANSQQKPSAGSSSGSNMSVKAKGGHLKDDSNHYESIEPTLVQREKMKDDVQVIQNATPVTPGEWRRRPRSRGRRSKSSSQERFRLSKLFNFRKSKVDHQKDILDDPGVLNEDNLHESLIEARTIPIVNWSKLHVIALVILELEMKDYLNCFMEHVQDGKHLASLTDDDLKTILNISNSFHKRKLRLAIEDYRAPQLWFPEIRNMTAGYTAIDFLSWIGLPQYKEEFENNLIDGRLLSELTRRQLQKQLNVTNKMHVASIIRSAELLRMFSFNIEVLAERRAKFDPRHPTDMIVWTNQNFIQWMKQLGLQAYGDRLRHSGINGALSVLDSESLSVNYLIQLLDIPTELYRGLLEDFPSLVIESQTSLDKLSNFTPGGQRKLLSGAGASFSRSFTSANVGQPAPVSGKQGGIRGSFGRVFGIKAIGGRSANRRKSISPVRSKSQEGTSASNKKLSELKLMEISSISYSDKPTETVKCPTEYRNYDPEPGNQSSLSSSGTVSSTTSDLGSSVERSHHMRALLANTPRSLHQATVCDKDSKRETKKNSPIHKQKERLSQSTDSAILSDMENNNNSNSSSWIPKIILRDKQKRRALGLSQSQGSSISARPHSISDFNSGVNVCRDPHVHTTRVNSMFPDQYLTPSVSSDQLKNWIMPHAPQGFYQNSSPKTQAHASKSSSFLMTPPPALERRIGTICEAAEYESDHTEHKGGLAMSAESTPLRDKRQALMRRDERPRSMDVSHLCGSQNYSPQHRPVINRQDVERSNFAKMGYSSAQNISTKPPIGADLGGNNSSKKRVPLATQNSADSPAPTTSWKYRFGFSPQRKSRPQSLPVKVLLEQAGVSSSQIFETDL